VASSGASSIAAASPPHRRGSEAAWLGLAGRLQNPAVLDVVDICFDDVLLHSERPLFDKTGQRERNDGIVGFALR
jgi:hypothetical protein